MWRAGACKGAILSRGLVWEKMNHKDNGKEDMCISLSPDHRWGMVQGPAGHYSHPPRIKTEMPYVGPGPSGPPTGMRPHYQASMAQPRAHLRAEGGPGFSWYPFPTNEHQHHSFFYCNIALPCKTVLPLFFWSSYFCRNRN